jgi:hypothetical protein
MPREPNEEKDIEDRSTNESETRKDGDYYYDDAHGYEDYDPEKDLDEDDSDD